jgi:excisionase family DNA binding protein
MPEDQDLTIDQVAQMLQRHRKTVESYIASGAMEAYKEGRTYRITRRAVERFRQERIVKPQEVARKKVA